MTQEELAELKARNDAIFKAQNEEWEREKEKYKNRKIKTNNKRNVVDNNKRESGTTFFIAIPMGLPLTIVFLLIFAYLIK